MTLSLFKKTSANKDTDNCNTSQLFSDGTYLFFASEGVPTYGQYGSNQRVYLRRVKISDQTLLDQDIFGSNVYGWSSPSMAQLDDGTLIAGATKGTIWRGLGTGFKIMECANPTAGTPTWGSAYTGTTDDGTNHQLRGLFTDGTECIAVTQDLASRGGRLIVHRRTAAGAWSRTQLFYNTTNPTANFWNLSFAPQQNGVVSGTRAMFVGNYATAGVLDTIAGYVTNDLVNWSLMQIAQYPGSPSSVRRIPMLLRSPLDGIVRLIHTHSMSSSGPGLPPRTGYSTNWGLSWNMNAADPHAFIGTDADGDPITWPREFDAVVSCALDARGRQILVMPDYGDRPFWRTFAAWGVLPQNWALVESATISEALTSPSGTIFAGGWDGTPLPAPSLIVGQDLYRIMNAWNNVTDPTNPYSEQWLCSSASVGKKSGGGSGGGGGLPFTFEA